MNLHERINELIILKGSMRQVAFSLDIDVGYLHHLEKGTKTNPSDKICNKLGLKKRIIIEYTSLI